MKFVQKLSLEHMALVKIGILLWKQNYAKFSYKDLCQSRWKKVEGRVIEKVPQLSLPQLLKEKVFGLIKPIGMQTFEWMRYYRKYNARIGSMYHLDLNVPANLSADLRWTPQGTVDRKRTAEVLVRDENLNVVKRYRLACDFCLEDDIIQFWNRLPEDLKDYDWHNFPVVRFWSDNMKRGRVGHISYVDVFYQSVRVDNKVAAEYFLQKLTAREREETLVEAAKWRYKTDVFYFLISEMDEDQQMLVFKNDPCRVMKCFLQWPFQGFFIGVANCMWAFLSRDNYDEILGAIICKVRDGYEDYNYQKLFGEFWQKGPCALKDSLIEKIDKSWLMLLLDIKDKENIRLILQDVTITAKEKFIYCDETKNIFRRYIRDNEWDFLEFFIRECFPSKNEMLKFKEEIEKYRITRFFKQNFATKKHIWDQLFSSSDVFICKSDKRNVAHLSDFGACSSTCLKQEKVLF